MRRIAFLESNLSGSGFQGLRLAKELGLHVTFMTRDLDRYLAVYGAKEIFDRYVDEIRFCETNDEESVWREITDAGLGPFEGFMTMGEYDIPVAAAIARRLGLPGLSPEAAAVSRNKLLTREVCRDKGVASPAFSAVKTEEELHEAIRVIGFPCVIKPSDETSSTDVVRCSSENEAMAHFETIRNKAVNTRGQIRTAAILVEECLIGYEVSVETITYKGSTRVLGVTDKMTAGGRHFVEIGHTFPSCLPDETVQTCGALAVAALEAVGFDFGVAHIEMKVTSEGPKLIEINGRPAGGRIPDLIELSCGFSSLRELVRMSIGLEPELPGAWNPISAKGAAIRFLTAQPGVVSQVQGLDMIARLPQVVEVSIPELAGRKVGMLQKNGDRLGYVIAAGKSSYEAGRIAETALQQIVIDVEAVGQEGQDANHRYSFA